MNVFLKNLMSGFFITLLFVLITPGVLLTLPTKGLGEGAGNFETEVIITHALVFYFLYFIVKIMLWVIAKALKPITKVGPATATATPTPSASASASASSSTVASSPRATSPPVSSPPMVKRLTR